MKASPAAGCMPLAISLRATGTEPHSHTGKAKPPIAAVGSCKPIGKRPIAAKALSGTNTSIAALTVAPSRTKGKASITIDAKMTTKVSATPQ